MEEPRFFGSSILLLVECYPAQMAFSGYPFFRAPNLFSQCIYMMNDLIKYPYSKGYRLLLNNGSGWWITSDEESASILQKAVEIMTLKESPPDGLPRLMFSRNIEAVQGSNEGNNTHSDLDILTASDEWSVFDFDYIHVWHHGDDPNVMCEVIDKPGGLDDYLVIWYLIHVIYDQSLSLGALPCHAGLAEYKGKGILLAAPGGVGKSTACSRLPDGWKSLCDDEALVVLDKNGTYRVHPFPTWSDYLFQRAQNTWDVQYSIPLSGIFFLEQSESDEVIPIASNQATLYISRSANEVFKRSRMCMNHEERMEQVIQVFNNACELAKAIPAFRLRVSLNGRFWEEIEKVLGL